MAPPQAHSATSAVKVSQAIVDQIEALWSGVAPIVTELRLEGGWKNGKPMILRREITNVILKKSEIAQSHQVQGEDSDSDSSSDDEEDDEDETREESNENQGVVVKLATKATRKRLAARARHQAQQEGLAAQKREADEAISDERRAKRAKIDEGDEDDHHTSDDEDENDRLQRTIEDDDAEEEGSRQRVATEEATEIGDGSNDKDKDKDEDRESNNSDDEQDPSHSWTAAVEAMEQADKLLAASTTKDTAGAVKARKEDAVDNAGSKSVSDGEEQQTQEDMEAARQLRGESDLQQSQPELPAPRTPSMKTRAQSRLESLAMEEKNDTSQANSTNSVPKSSNGYSQGLGRNPRNLTSRKKSTPKKLPSSVQESSMASSKTVGTPTLPLIETPPGMLDRGRRYARMRTDKASDDDDDDEVEVELEDEEREDQSDDDSGNAEDRARRQLRQKWIAEALKSSKTQKRQEQTKNSSGKASIATNSREGAKVSWKMDPVSEERKRKGASIVVDFALSIADEGVMEKWRDWITSRMQPEINAAAGLLQLGQSGGDGAEMAVGAARSSSLETRLPEGIRESTKAELENPDNIQLLNAARLFGGAWDQLKRDGADMVVIDAKQRLGLANLWQAYEQMTRAVDERGGSNIGLTVAVKKGSGSRTYAKQLLFDYSHPSSSADNETESDPIKVAQYNKLFNAFGQRLSAAHRWWQMREKHGYGSLCLVSEEKVGRRQIELGTQTSKAEFEWMLEHLEDINPRAIEKGRQFEVMADRITRDKARSGGKAVVSGNVGTDTGVGQMALRSQREQSIVLDDVDFSSNRWKDWIEDTR